MDIYCRTCMYTKLTVFMVVLVSVQVCLAERCSDAQFTCTDLSCASFYSQCDGQTNCNDGSDESSSTCPDGTETLFEDGYMVVSDYGAGYLNQIEVKTGKVRRITGTGPTGQNGSAPRAVDVKSTTKDIYYTDSESQSLKVFEWSTKTSRVIIDTIGPNATDITVYLEDHVIYYIDLAAKVISEINMTSGAERKIQQGGGIDPRSFVYGRVDKMIYWSDIGSSPGIYKCSAVDDPAEKVALVTDNVPNVRAFNIDWTERKMYWIDSTTNIFERSDLDGSSREVLKQERWLRYTSLIITTNHIFFVEPSRRAVRAGEKHNLDFHLYRGQRFTSLFDVDATLGDADLCMLDYEHCAGTGCVYKYHICDGKDDCEDGSDEVAPLCSGGRKEYLTDNYIVVADEIHAAYYQINIDTGEVIHISEMEKTYLPWSIAIHPDTGDIYSANDGDQTITHFSMTAKESKVIYKQENRTTSIGALALDAQNGLLYFANNEAPGYIDEISIADGTVVRRIVEGTNETPCCGMYIDQETRRLYWSDQGAGKIYYISLDEPGAEKVTIVQGDFAPSAFTIDFSTKEMFWTDNKANVIEKANLDGSSREVIYTDPVGRGRYYRSMTYDSEYIYFTDSLFNGLRRLDRVTFEPNDYEDQSFASLNGIAFRRPENATTITTSSGPSRPSTAAEGPSTLPGGPSDPTGPSGPPTSPGEPVGPSTSEGPVGPSTSPGEPVGPSTSEGPVGPSISPGEPVGPSTSGGSTGPSTSPGGPVGPPTSPEGPVGPSTSVASGDGGKSKRTAVLASVLSVLGLLLIIIIGCWISSALQSGAAAPGYALNAGIISNQRPYGGGFRDDRDYRNNVGPYRMV